MVDAATSFKKAGYSEEDSAQLALVASLYQNIADEALTAGESADFIISQMKAFNLTAADSEHIVNAVNDVYVLTNYWFVWIPAGFLILITVLGFNFVGDGLRDAFDPKMKR